LPDGAGDDLDGFEVTAIMRVVVVNPQPIWAQRVKARLSAAGAQVLLAEDWASGEALLDDIWPDVVIVEDRILEREAERMLAALRRGEWLPLIVPTDLTVLNAESEQVSPRAEESLRRLEALVTRLRGVFVSAAQQPIRVGKLTVDPARKEVVFAARRVPLPPNQFRLLLYLALNAGRVIDPRELVREVWGYIESESQARELVKTHVRLIRRKLGWSEEETNYLQSVRGFGYMLSPPPKGAGQKQ
jgi:DNA-binding response OmpR family regulator